MTAIEERDELAVALDRLREELRELESVVPIQRFSPLLLTKRLVQIDAQL